MTPEDTAVKSARHRPFEWMDGRASVAILVHGYAGSPDQFRTIAERLRSDGHDVAALLLPGHGAGSRAFGHDWNEAWRSHVETEVDRLRQGHNRVVLIGHSLGGLLCLEYAARHPDNPIDAIVTLSTPLGVRLSFFHIWFSLEMLFTGLDRGRPIARTYHQGFGVRMDNPLSPLAFLPPGLSFLKTLRRVRKCLPQVRVPVLIIQSDRDETVSRKSAERIAAFLGTPGRILRLQLSRHAWRTPEEDAIVVDEISRLMSGCFSADENPCKIDAESSIIHLEGS